jgi:hypothetical protein
MPGFRAALTVLAISSAWRRCMAKRASTWSRAFPSFVKIIGGDRGSRAGGTLFSDGLTDEKGPAPTYIAMVRHNIKALTSVLGR